MPITMDKLATSIATLRRTFIEYPFGSTACG